MPYKMKLPGSLANNPGNYTCLHCIISLRLANTLNNK